MPERLVLHHTDFVYTRMKAVSWTANETFFPTMLQANAGQVLFDIYQNVDPSKPLVVNCQGMAGMDDHAVACIAPALRRQKRTLVFINAESLEPLLRQSLETLSVHPVGGDVVCAYGDPSPSQPELRQMVTVAARLEFQRLNALVKNSYRPFDDGPQRLTSTPLLASGVFNARSLISDPISFVWTSLLMAEKVDELIQQDEPVKVRLLAVSLRASPLAAAVNLLARNELPLEIIDHMGPKHKILEEHSLKGISHGINYVFVADFIIGGTELKIAESYAYRNGCTVSHAVAIGTALAPSDYSSRVRVLPLVDLRQCHPDAKFGFGQIEEC